MRLESGVGFRETCAGGLKEEERNWSRSAMPDSYWPSSKQVSTRPRWCMVISRSSFGVAIVMDREKRCEPRRAVVERGARDKNNTIH